MHKGCVISENDALFLRKNYLEATGQISLISLTKIAMALDIADELRNIFTHVPYKDIQEVINEGR